MHYKHQTVNIQRREIFQSYYFNTTWKLIVSVCHLLFFFLKKSKKVLFVAFITFLIKVWGHFLGLAFI